MSHPLQAKKFSKNITRHGRGNTHGKGEGLVFLDQVLARRKRDLQAVEPLRSELLTTDFYERYRENGNKIDAGMERKLRDIHASLGDERLSIRPSEKDENNPFVATSGENTSHMLPNNHNDDETRFGQFLQAIKHCFDDFADKVGIGGAEERDGVAVVVNTIPGVYDRTRAGIYYYPQSSGVLDSMCNPFAGRHADEGFARVVYGHGYGAVLELKEVKATPIMSVMNPVDTKCIKNGQRFFFAIDMRRNDSLVGKERETMSTLNISLANTGLISPFGITTGGINFGKLVGGNERGYMDGLQRVMRVLREEGSKCFQIEYTFNVFENRGVFHIVQYKRLPDMLSRSIDIPDGDAFLRSDRVQGHGTIHDLKRAIIISPFHQDYDKDNLDQRTSIIRKLAELNQRMRNDNERYVLVVPGRLGSTNREWGLDVDFQDISQTAMIVEYGYDSSGSPTIEVTDQEKTGGIFGSHFLYAALGGMGEDDRIREMRRLGSQGTHFNTNLLTAGIVYVHVDPVEAADEKKKNMQFSDWFFDVPVGTELPIFVREFEHPVTAHADLKTGRCALL